MVDEVVTPEVESVPEVSTPVKSSKPYDDDMFEAYAEETPKEETPPVAEVKKVEPPKVDEKIPPIEAKKDAPLPIEESVVKQTINGKEVDIKVKDALSAYVKQEEFNRNMDSRLNTVSKREKAWENSQNTFKDKLKPIISAAENGDFITPIRALAKLAIGDSGLDVTEFEKKYFAQLDKAHDIYTKMSPEQREAFFAKRALDDAKARTKELEEEKTVNTAKSQLQSHVDSLQKAHGLTNDEFWSNYSVIEKNLVGEGKAFQSLAEVTAEEVVRFSLDVRHEEKVIQAGEKLGVKDEALLDEVAAITKARPDFTVDDIASVIEKSGVAKIAPQKVVENLNRKAGKSNTRSSQASSTKKDDAIEGYDKETLDELYRKSPKAYQRPRR